MRLSMVFELLLIFLLVAFAAYARVIDRNEVTLHRILRAASTVMKQSNVGVSTISLKQATDNVNKYCTCNDNICNCCRDFNIPVVQLKGPGCASVQYLKGDNMALQLSFGDNILTSTVVNGKSPKPVCVPLPGGFSKFCGRIYSIQREANDHFKACLGLELESSRQVEASLRVSCFRFGPDGLKLRPAEPLPVVESDSSSDDDDDDDDIFGLGSVGDDDEDDDDDDDDEDDEDSDDDTPSGNAVPSSSAGDDEDDDEEDDDDDVLGLGSLFDIFGDDDAPSKKPKVTTPSPVPISIPLLTKPISEAPNIVEAIEPPASVNEVPIKTDVVEPSKPAQEEIPATNLAQDVTQQVDVVENHSAVPVVAEQTTSSTPGDLVPLGSVIKDNVLQPSASSVEEEYVPKPEQAVVKPTSIVNKIKPALSKPTITSGSINAIQNDIKKPSKPDPVKNEAATSGAEEEEEEEEEDEEEDILGAGDLVSEEEEDDEKEETVEEEVDETEEETEVEATEDSDEEEETENEDSGEKKPESGESDEESIVDDDDEEEDALITELTSDEVEKKKGDKISNNEAEDPEEDDGDYGFGLAEMLARKRQQRHMRGGRQSRVMRL